uniref:Uncharacterized protein n=1 Tax=Chromera velia CCMP2878 TaxID=1169474 RepID=A0A0G4HIZ8_9ALVE|eukprot:Cvel_28017.t1-p1 / transcript=Cvel_28017.t1 / gene=Cvel_28017 / organism=Chromera_velia_CCMP2878 / gene_product=hypothetical protein / transcript_product=hypothetical protein / location=Cvel_scaffold3594:3837-4262(-) / protein_length=142 / sequence_SO=supercontig / SO=protein_coding / is_pseudo=false
MNSQMAPRGFFGVSYDLLVVAVPMCFASLSSNFLHIFLSFLFVGQFSSVEETAGYGIASALGWCIILAPGIGLCSGLDTLCSQAFGAEAYLICAQWLHRAQAILVMFSLIIVTLAMMPHIECLFILFGQEVEVALVAGRVTR